MPVSDAGRKEAQEFLRWAANDHFTFFGYREYDGQEEGRRRNALRGGRTGLGLLRGKEIGKPRQLKSLAAHYMPQSGSVDALILTKTNARATVHRPGYMDYIGVLSFDAKGQPVRRTAFPRLVHLQRLQPPPVGHPAGARTLRIRDARVGARAQQPQRQGAQATSWKRCRATSCSSRPRTSCSASPPASSACRSACAASCSCAATAMAASTRCWSTSRATASTPTCACASKAMLKQRAARRARRHQRAGRRIAAGAAAPDRAPDAPARSVDVDQADARSRTGQDRAQLAGRTARAADRAQRRSSRASHWRTATAAPCRPPTSNRSRRRSRRPTSSTLPGCATPDDLRLSLYRSAYTAPAKAACASSCTASTATSRCRTRCR